MRRLKRMSLPTGDLGTIGLTPDGGMHFEVPALENRCRAVSVEYNKWNRHFEVVLEDESFPVVPDGEEPPYLEGWEPV